MASLIRILIVEDDKNLRQAWKAVLDLEPRLCVLGTFDTCEKLLEFSGLERADVLLMDIGLPGMSGTEGVKRVLKVNSDILIIMASVYEDDRHIFEALSNGAIGYLHKKVNSREMVTAIQDAVAGGSPMSPGIARKVISSFQHQEEAAVEPLKDRELEILKELVDGKSYRQIGEHIYLSVDGVRYHIRNIYRKLHVNNRSEAVAKAIYQNIINPD